MKQINKGREPRSLTEHRASGGTYKGWDNSELRQQLLEEQGYICCYCMKRIPEKDWPHSKIEHVKSQKKHLELQLNYRNLLIACTGNENGTKIMRSCDTSKGEKDLSFNPSDNAHNIEPLIKYLSNGEIRSIDPAIDNELDNILHLNTKDLRDTRAGYYKMFDDKIKQKGNEYKGKQIPRSFFEAEKEQLLIKFGGKFPEFCMVAVYLLNKRLSKLN
ncbi:MAG: TIGR02646 family protein [Bacteroidota bacterium]|nr:TIGR02646 family protein [Bacteroidota bacterium]